MRRHPQSLSPTRTWGLVPDFEDATPFATAAEAESAAREFTGFLWSAHDGGGTFFVRFHTASDQFIGWLDLDDADLAEAAEGDFCAACGRPSLDCSRDPCADVIEDRGED